MTKLIDSNSPSVSAPEILSARDGAGNATSSLSAIDASVTLAAGDFSTLAVLQGDANANALGSTAETAAVTIYGAAGNDTLSGGSGDDQLFGEDGNDVLIGWSGNDTFNGGLGTDTVSYATETGGAGVVVNLSNAGLTRGATTLQALTGTDTWGNLDTYVQIENVTGSAYDDFMTAAGTFVSRYFIGGAGNDTLIGGGGFDTLDGGAGDDVIVGGAGKNFILANLGSDTVFAAGGNDTVTGNWSTTLTYENAQGRISADLSSGLLDEYLASGALTSSDKVSQIKTFIGTAFNDIIIGAAVGQHLMGMGGDDRISGGTDPDTIDGGDGNDSLSGGFGNDLVLGGSGSDTLAGGDGADTLDGGAGDDITTGGLGNDVYYVDSLDDITIELNGTTGGYDTVYVSVANFDGAKLANIENVILVGDGSVIGTNAVPVIGGASAPVTVSVLDTETATPFASVTITDDSPTVTVTVTMGDLGDGTFGNLGSGTFNAATGRYTVTGDAATVQAALQALQFDPMDHPDYAVGSAYRINFTIAVVDSNGVSGVSNSNISVDAITANRAPTIVAAATTFTVDDSANLSLVSPFVDVTIGDTNHADVVTVTIALDAAAKGVLVPGTGGSYDTATGIFTMTGAVADVLAAVRSLQFNPEDRLGAPNNSIETTTFTISVADAGGLLATNSAIQVDSVHLENLGPGAPTLSSGAITDAAQDGAVVGTLSAIDPEGDAVTFTFVDALANSGGLVSVDGRFEIVNGEVTVRDQGLIQVTQETAFTYAIEASDGNGGATTANVTITVADQNQAPSLTQISNAKIAEHAAIGTVIGVLAATDPNGDALTYTLLDDSNGRVELVGNEIRVKNNAAIDFEQFSQFGITVAASDGGETVLTNLRITVTDVRQENVMGTAGHDVIKGGSGRDVLNGGAGNDFLYGGGGIDQLTGGTGADAFVFDTALSKSSADLIVDFSVAEGDQIRLAKSIFTDCGLFGMMKASAFVNGTTALDADDRIIYDGTTGRIFFDRDGAGGTNPDSQPVLVATLTGSVPPMLTAASFYMI